MLFLSIRSFNVVFGFILFLLMAMTRISGAIAAPVSIVNACKDTLSEQALFDRKAILSTQYLNYKKNNIALLKTDKGIFLQNTLINNDASFLTSFAENASPISGYSFARNQLTIHPYRKAEVSSIVEGSKAFFIQNETGAVLGSIHLSANIAWVKLIDDAEFEIFKDETKMFAMVVADHQILLVRFGKESPTEIITQYSLSGEVDSIRLEKAVHDKVSHSILSSYSIKDKMFDINMTTAEELHYLRVKVKLKNKTIESEFNFGLSENFNYELLESQINIETFDQTPRLYIGTGARIFDFGHGMVVRKNSKLYYYNDETKLVRALGIEGNEPVYTKASIQKNTMRTANFVVSGNTVLLINVDDGRELFSSKNFKELDFLKKTTLVGLGTLGDFLFLATPHQVISFDVYAAMSVEPKLVVKNVYTTDGTDQIVSMNRSMSNSYNGDDSLGFRLLFSDESKVRDLVMYNIHKNGLFWYSNKVYKNGAMTTVYGNY